MKMFLLQLLAWIGICSSVQSFLIPTSGRLEADHLLFYVGENMTLHCYKESIFTGNVIFYIGGILQNTKYITRVNNTYVRLERPVTSDDYAEAVGSCRDDNGLVNQLTKIFTDYAPQSATYFQMVWLEKSRVITHWKHGLENITYKNSHTAIVIKITSEWRRVRNDSGGHWHICQNSTNTSCTVPNIINSADIISVRVNVTNVLRKETVTTVFPGRKVRDHAQPKPPKLNSIDDIKKKSIRITVSNDWPSLIRRVTYCAVEENECSTVDIPPLNQSGEIGHPQTMVVTGLHPSYTYTVRVQDKFENGGYFSDYTDPQTVTMLKDAPSIGPQVTAGSFYWDRTQCSKTPPSATVYIFFQEVPKEQRNGQLTSYSAEVSSAGNAVNVSIPASGPKTLKVVNLDCQTGFQASLYASTKEGRSPASALSVPAWDQELYNKVKYLDLRLRVENGNVTAEWNTNPDLFGYTFYLYYCTRNTADPDQCQDSVKTVPLNTVERNASVTDDAISMLGSAAITPLGHSVGIVRSSCIYNPNKRGYEVSNVQAIPQDDRIVVTWQAKQCDYIERIRIHQYEVEVCAPTQKQDCLRQRVDGDKNSWSTDKMEVGTGYRVRMRAYIEDTGWTGFSNPRFVDVPDQSAQGYTAGQIAGIVSGALVFCIILGTSIFCCYLRDKQNRLRRYFCENIEKSDFQHDVGAQDKPHLDGVDNFGAISDCDNNNLDDSGKGCPPLIKQQISDDSGCYPNSPPLSPTSDTPGPVTMEPGQPAQPSPSPNTPSLGDDLLDGTHPSHTSTDRLSQDTTDADGPSQEEDSIIPPYVTATNVSAASNASVIGLDIEPSGKEGNEHTVCFVTHAPPKLGNIFPLALPEGCMPFGVPDRRNMIKKEEDASGIVLDPSALEITEKKTPSASPVVPSYVKLSTADAMGHDFPDEEMDNKFAFGEDDSDDDAAVEDGPTELLPTSALGGIQDVEEQRRTAGYHASKDLAEEPHLVETETKMNSAYVLLQSSHMDAVAADEEAQVPNSLLTDSQQSDQGMAGHHPGYVPHTIQSMQTQLTLSEEEEGDDKHISRQVEGESPSSPRDGYVPLPPLPRAASLPEDHGSHSFAASSSESEDSDADSNDIHHDYLSKGISEGHPTSSKDKLDGNGYVRIDHSPDGCSLFTQGNGPVSSSNKSQTSTNGKSFAEKSSLEDRKTDQVRVNSNGYVAWQNLPFQKNQQSQC